MNKLSLAFVAGSMCAFSFSASAQVYVNDTPPPVAPVIVTTAPPPQGQVMVDPREYGGGSGQRLGGNRLIWTGVAMFGVSYAVAIIGGAAVNDTCVGGNCDYSFGARNWLFVPLIGPFIAMGDIEGTNAGQIIARVLLATDGILQVGGATMAVLGIVFNNNSPAYGMIDRRVRIMPFATGSATGLAAYGHF